MKREEQLPKIVVIDLSANGRHMKLTSNTNHKLKSIKFVSGC